MEIHQLRYFLAVAKTGNFSRAAESCHVAQPSLSQQILKLEQELGEKLFERQARRAVLTAAGQILRRRAETILEEVSEAQREVRDVGGEARGKVFLGALPTMAPYYLPTIIPVFSGKYPGIELVVHEETTAHLLEALQAHELDLAVLSLPITAERIETHLLFREELLVALPAGHRLLARTHVALEDLSQEKFILLHEAHCLSAQSMEFCVARDFCPQVTCRSAQMETVQALVEAGMGISLVPAMACRSRGQRGVEYRPLDAPAPSRAIVLAWNGQRTLSRAARELKDFMIKGAG